MLLADLHFFLNCRHCCLQLIRCEFRNEVAVALTSNRSKVFYLLVSIPNKLGIGVSSNLKSF